MTRRHSLEARRQFWDNRTIVNKYLAPASLLASIFAIGLSLAGCQKSADLGRVQEESLELVKVHVRVLDQLQRRADALLERGQIVGSKAGPNSQGIADAGRILTEARARLDELRSITVQAPSAIAAAAKTGTDEQLYKTSDETVEKLEDGATLVRADLDAVEQWLAIAEGRPMPAAPAMPPTATSTSPSSAPGTGAAAAGSAAPAPTR